MTPALAPFAIVCACALILAAAQYLHRRKAPDPALFPELSNRSD